MVMLSFDVPYLHGELAAIKISRVKEAGSSIQRSAAAPLAAHLVFWRWKLQPGFQRQPLCLGVHHSVRACMCVFSVDGSRPILSLRMWCAWICERAPAFIKSVAPALTFTPPPKCFVVFICLPSDTDSIPPPSASTAPLPKCLAEGEDSSTAPLPGKRSAVKDTQHKLDT